LGGNDRINLKRSGEVAANSYKSGWDDSAMGVFAFELSFSPQE